MMAHRPCTAVIGLLPLLCVACEPSVDGARPRDGAGEDGQDAMDAQVAVADAAQRTQDAGLSWRQRLAQAGIDPAIPIDCTDQAPPNAGEAGTDGGLPVGEHPGEEVCGCDGRIHLDVEAALAAQVRIDMYDYCLIPDHLFGCGPLRCVLGEESCSAWSDHSAAQRFQDHQCLPLGQGGSGMGDSERQCVAAASCSRAVCECFGPGCFAKASGRDFAIYDYYTVPN